MTFNREEADLEIADKLAQFVKLRLLGNQTFMRDNGTKTMTVSDALSKLDRLERTTTDFGYPVEYTKGYEQLHNECSGSISFTAEEIDEIADTVKTAIIVCGLPQNTVYWDVINFATDRLEQLVNTKTLNSKLSCNTDAEYIRALKWKKCLHLTHAPLYYVPYSGIISCGFPKCAVRIMSDEAGTIYQVDNALNVQVDKIDALLGEISLGEVSDENSEEHDEEKAIFIAADWWTRALTDPMFAIRYDASASFISSILAISNSMFGKHLSDEAIKLFRESLEEQIRAGIKNNGHYTIRAHSNLDPALRVAMQKANIVDLDYSLGTFMDISPSEVVLTVGSNEENKQVLYSSKKEVKDLQKTIGTRESGK